MQEIGDAVSSAATLPTRTKIAPQVSRRDLADEELIPLSKEGDEEVIG